MICEGKCLNTATGRREAFFLRICKGNCLVIKLFLKGLVKENASTQLLVTGRPFAKGFVREYALSMPLGVLSPFPQGFEGESASGQLLSVESSFIQGSLKLLLSGCDSFIF